MSFRADVEATELDPVFHRWRWKSSIWYECVSVSVILVSLLCSLALHNSAISNDLQFIPMFELQQSFSPILLISHIHGRMCAANTLISRCTCRMCPRPHAWRGTKIRCGAGAVCAFFLWRHLRDSWRHETTTSLTKDSDRGESRLQLLYVLAPDENCKADCTMTDTLENTWKRGRRRWRHSTTNSVTKWWYPWRIF